jgi:hypothetical protein
MARPFFESHGSELMPLKRSRVKRARLWLGHCVHSRDCAGKLAVLSFRIPQDFSESLSCRGSVPFDLAPHDALPPQLVLYPHFLFSKILLVGASLKLLRYLEFRPPPRPRFSLLKSRAATAQKAGISPTYQTYVQKVVTSPLPMPIAWRIFFYVSVRAVD